MVEWLLFHFSVSGQNLELNHLQIVHFMFLTLFFGLWISHFSKLRYMKRGVNYKIVFLHRWNILFCDKICLFHREQLRNTQSACFFLLPNPLPHPSQCLFNIATHSPSRMLCHHFESEMYTTFCVFVFHCQLYCIPYFGILEGKQSVKKSMMCFKVKKIFW